MDTSSTSSRAARPNYLAVIFLVSNVVNKISWNSDHSYTVLYQGSDAVDWVVPVQEQADSVASGAREPGERGLAERCERCSSGRWCHFFRCHFGSWAWARMHSPRCLTLSRPSRSWRPWIFGTTSSQRYADSTASCFLLLIFVQRLV